MEAYQRSLEIDRQIEKDRKVFEQRSRDPKVLILGSGDSGKTTLLKQMQILHGGGFSEKEVFRFMKLLHQSMVVNMQRLLKVSVGMKPENEAQQYLIANLSDWNLDDIHAQVMQALWDDPAVRTQLWSDVSVNNERSKLHPSMHWFFENIKSVLAPDYVPSDQDVLNLRVPTQAVSETVFDIVLQSGVPRTFRFYDVGGQRGLRKAWAPFFDDVNAVIFVTSAASYCEFLDLEEDDLQTNRMRDAMMLFQQIAENKLLANAGLVLFLNKIDLLPAKIKESPLTQHFKEFKGADTPEAYIKHFHREFFKLCPRERELFVHKTCCTDTKSMKVIIWTVLRNVISKDLQDVGVL
ncbi:guanine nucleotide binding protein, alpha subunit [Gorgonomyces haynaldii]|nr:guanine nucleotide binding protein, alpha subunit [Gorgonomyces haynaldii]